MRINRTRIAAVAALTMAGLGIALWSGIGRPDSAQAQASDAATAGITVMGTGSVKAAPDRADFSFGVQSDATTASAALSANNAAVQNVIDALKGAGVDSSDIQTQQVSVSPRYDSGGQKVVGYTATNSVNATLRDLARAGAIVDAAVKAGANNVYGPTLAIADQTQLYQAALKKSFDDARTKAQGIAAAAGVSLGRVTNIVEGSTAGSPIPLTAGAATDQQSVPIQPGLQEVDASLTVTFSIG